MNDLVTGGAGMIGSHLVDELLAEGATVTVLDNFLTGRRQNLAHLRGAQGLRVSRTDVAAPWPRDVLSERYDRIFHLASPASPPDFARYPIETLLTNANGTERALRLAARDGARFVFASTSEVYGDPLEHPQREEYRGNVNPVGPRSCYNEGKRFAESLTATFGDVHGLDVRIARIFNTYGPRSRPDDGRIVPNFCVQALAGRPLTIYGDGSQTRSLCYVADLVRGLLALMETDGLAGEVVNLGCPEEQTVREIAERVIAVADFPAGVDFAPLPTDDPRRRRPSIDKARRLLGWTPTTDLDTGLRCTVAYFRDTLRGTPVEGLAVAS